MQQRQHNWADPVTHATAKAACAKNGQTLGNFTSSDQRELMAVRNTVRATINDTRDRASKAIAANDDKVADAAMDELEALSAIMNCVQTRLDNCAEGARLTAGNRAGPVLMRNEADFRRQYGEPQEGITALDFFRGVAKMQTTDAVRNALSVGTDTAGGFTVPSTVMPEILSALAPVSSLMQAGMPIATLDQGTKTATTAVVNAIPSAAWRAEAGTLAQSDPTFRSVPATPRSLAFYFKCSRELLMDSPNMNSALLQVIAQAFAKKLDYTGLRGSGTAPEPAGLLTTSGIQTVTNGANGTALGSYANLFSAAQKVLEADGPTPTAAIMSPRSLVKLGGLLDSTGQPVNVPPMLQPVKLIATSQVPNNLTVGTSNDCSEIYVGDFTRMALLLRENVSVQVLNEAFATTGEIGFACHVRADFAVWYPAAFALVTGVRP